MLAFRAPGGVCWHPLPCPGVQGSEPVRAGMLPLAGAGLG